MHLKNEVINSIHLNLEKELKNIVNKDIQYTIPIFIPHKGCPNDCVFCNQRKISGTISNVTVEDVDNIIKERLKSLKDTSRKIQVAFFGGSFTGIKIEEQIGYLRVAGKYINEGKVDSIRISTRPDYISPPILKMLKIYHVKTIELGVQSMDNKVLELSKRGHDKKSVVRASILINKYGFELGHQMMVGLPGSTIESEIYTIEELLKLGPKQLRIYPVYVISPSELYDMYETGKYLPLSLDEAITRTYEVILKCQKTDVKIIRIGLQSTDEITQSNNGLVGPICDNFAEFVLARIVREKLEETIVSKCIDIDGIANIVEVYVPYKYISIVSGPKKINKKFFEEKYNIRLIVKGE